MAVAGRVLLATLAVLVATVPAGSAAARPAHRAVTVPARPGGTARARRLGPRPGGLLPGGGAVAGRRRVRRPRGRYDRQLPGRPRRQGAEDELPHRPGVLADPATVAAAGDLRGHLRPPR